MPRRGIVKRYRIRIRSGQSLVVRYEQHTCNRNDRYRELPTFLLREQQTLHLRVQVLDRQNTCEILRALLHAILFHRLFGTIKPQSFEVLDVTMVCHLIDAADAFPSLPL
jgi:Autophagy-related protein 101